LIVGDRPCSPTVLDLGFLTVNVRQDPAPRRSQGGGTGSNPVGAAGKVQVDGTFHLGGTAVEG
jgi:hypothetical protein